MKKTCVLFIHGIGANHVDTWGDLICEIAEQKKHFGNIDLEHFEYESSKLEKMKKIISKFTIKACQSMIGQKDSNNNFGSITIISKELKTFIDGYKFNKYDEIFIIAHSMGGLIATRYLLDEISSKKHLKVKKTLYICTPLIGSVFADFLDKLGLTTNSTREMTIKSDFLKKLWSDYEQHKFEENIDCTFLFGSQDEIIEDCYKVIGKEYQKTIAGDHHTVLKKENLDANFEHIRKFIIEEEKPKTFIGNLYSRSELFRNISSENKFERVVSLQKAKQRFERNSLNNLLGDTDKQLFNQLKKTIHSESYSPHEAYYGKNYYVNSPGNEGQFEAFLRK